jgi:hypothetical protein
VPQRPQRIQLQRTFTPVADRVNSKHDAQDFDYAQYWQPNGDQTSVFWEQLLEHPFCVVSGEAGIGKTTEFEGQADSLQKEGKAAFFVPLDVALDKDSLFDRLSAVARPLNAWLAGSDIGYFFLDGVDEARLGRPCDLEAALRNVVRRLTPENAMERARFILSSRIGDWGIPDVPAIAAEVINGARQRSGQTTIEPLIYSLDRLSPADAKALAQWYGVTDVDPFWKAVERQGFEFMVTIPLDLERMAEYWKQRGQFGGLTEMLEASIDKRLHEHNPSHQKKPASLPLEDMRRAAELLAAVCCLSGRPFVAVPDYRGAASVNTVAVNEILGRWTTEQVRTLLSTAVFDEASYGHVRFHHRTAREYLAAKWISRRMHEGWPLRAVLSLFISDPFGDGLVVVESRQPVLSWLASMEPKIRECVISTCPDTVFSGGDPEEWSAEDVERALRNFARLRFEALAVRAAPLDVGTLTRIGRRAGETVLTSLLDACAADIGSMYSTHLAIHFLHIVRYAALKGCSDAVYRLYRNNDNGRMLKGHALATLAVVATEEQRKGVRQDLLEQRITGSGQCAQACRVVFPGYLSAKELVDVLVATEAQPNEGGPMSEYMRREVLSRSNGSCATALLDAVDSSLSKSYEQLANSRLHALLPEIFAAALLNHEVDSEAPSVLCRGLFYLAKGMHVSPFWHGAMRAGLQSRIDDFMVAHPRLRRSLALAFAENRPEGVWALGKSGPGGIKLLIEDDLLWARELAANRTLSEVQRRAAFLLLVVATSISPIPPYCRRALIREAIATCDNVERREVWDSDLASRWQVSRYRRREERRQRQLVAKRGQQRATQQQYLKSNEAAIRRGNHLDGLIFVMYHYVKPFEGGELGDINGGTFAQEYGSDLWEAVKDGFRKFWRKMDAPSRAGSPPSRVPDIALAGLVGIALDIEDGYDVRSKRSAAARLARYALWNITGAPAWFDGLASAYPEPVADAIWTDVERDLTAPMAGNARTALDIVMQGPAVLRAAIAKRLCQVLRETTADGSTLPEVRYRQVLEIIRDTGVADEQFLESRVRPLLEAYARDGNWQGAGYWLGFLLTIIPARAWEQVETLWNSGAERSETDAVRLACGLAGGSGPIVGIFPALNFLPNTQEMVSVIEKMGAFFLGHIRAESDIRRQGGGAYSPGERDIAQSVRDNLPAQLGRIPGRVAHASLGRLARACKDSPQGASLMAFAHNHASEEAKELASLEPKDIPSLGEKYCREPRSEAELFDVVLARLETIKQGVEAGPFSDRVLFEAGMAEKKLQLWLAARLDETCGRHGFRVSREDEVDASKKPDVHIHHAKGTVCLEIKPLDKERYSARELKAAISDQLVDQYMGGRNSHHGILVLLLLENRRWRLPGKSHADLRELLAFLEKYANTLKANRPADVEGLKVVGIDCTEHRVPEVVCKSARSSMRAQG